MMETKKAIAIGKAHDELNLFRQFFWLIVSMMAFLIVIPPALADEEAENFMRGVLAKANVAMAADNDISRFEGVADLVDQYADMRRTGRFVLGQYARVMSAEQAATYYPLFEDYATSIYQEVLSAYSGEQLEVTNSIDRSARDIIVNSRIANAKPGDQFANTNIQWRLYRTPNGLKIVDAGADNIWLAIEQRSQFTSIIANNGGRSTGIDALIEQLKVSTGN